jgi:hypothetical protein
VGHHVNYKNKSYDLKIEVPHSKLRVTSGVARRASGTTASGGNINILNKEKLVFCIQQILRY